MVLSGWGAGLVQVKKCHIKFRVFSYQSEKLPILVKLEDTMEIKRDGIVMKGGSVSEKMT